MLKFDLSVYYLFDAYFALIKIQHFRKYKLKINLVYKKRKKQGKFYK